MRKPSYCTQFVAAGRRHCRSNAQLMVTTTAHATAGGIMDPRSNVDMDDCIGPGVSPSTCLE